MRKRVLKGRKFELLRPGRGHAGEGVIAGARADLRRRSRGCSRPGHAVSLAIVPIVNQEKVPLMGRGGGQPITKTAPIHFVFRVRRSTRS